MINVYRVMGAERPFEDEFNVKIGDIKIGSIDSINSLLSYISSIEGSSSSFYRVLGPFKDGHYIVDIGSHYKFYAAARSD